MTIASCSRQPAQLAALYRRHRFPFEPAKQAHGFLEPFVVGMAPPL